MSFTGFWQATHPQKLISVETPKDFGWEAEDVELVTSDGLKLSAWFVPSKNPTDAAIVLLHGYPADKGNLLPWATFLKDSYNLFFFDFRYFGRSAGSYTSLGFEERKDVLAAVEFLEKRGIEKIGLMGFSFGASVALLTLPETGNVATVVADSAFANLDLMGKTYYGNLLILQKPLTFLTKFWGRLIYQIDADKIVPEKAVKDSQTPIFIIANRNDNLIKVENAEKLANALKNNKNAKIWIYDGGVHGEIGGAEYNQKILEFFSKNL